MHGPACRGRPTDVYALGACLYTFAFGRIPFNAPNVFKLFQVVQHEPLRFPDSPTVSSDLKDLLLKMLCKVRGRLSCRCRRLVMPSVLYVLLAFLATCLSLMRRLPGRLG